MWRQIPIDRATPEPGNPSPTKLAYHLGFANASPAGRLRGDAAIAVWTGKLAIIRNTPSIHESPAHHSAVQLSPSRTSDKPRATYRGHLQYAAVTRFDR
ncbi:hypothetical protein CHU98_g4039 [Xylaria longipes]|nr:hypothetical protein CHU98_g4039 [Xylaria longipes]